jgi:hypothetical protein
MVTPKLEVMFKNISIYCSHVGGENKSARIPVVRVAGDPKAAAVDDLPELRLFQ